VAPIAPVAPAGPAGPWPPPNTGTIETISPDTVAFASITEFAVTV